MPKASVKVVSYIEAVKNKPGIWFHVALFVVMMILNVAVWRSLNVVFPGQGSEMGKFAIVASALCILVVIAMIVRASAKTAKRALVLIVIATALEAAEYGCHWLYARELSASQQAQLEIDRQKVLNDGLADKNAERASQVLDKLADYNRSQSNLAKADADYYRRTGVRRTRKVGEIPSFEELGVVANRTAPTPTPQSVLVSALTMGNQQQVEVPETPLTEAQVLAKWTPRFALAGILRLIFVFVGTAFVLASWEWDMNGNGIADSQEGKV